MKTMIPLSRFDAILVQRDELRLQSDDLRKHAWSLHERHASLEEDHQRAIALLQQYDQQIDHLIEINQKLLEAHTQRTAEMDKFVSALEREHAARCPCCGVTIDSIDGRPLNS